ncbi:MAG TPA: hypothetical protein VF186_03920 [Gaiellaceae bacterium]
MRPGCPARWLIGSLAATSALLLAGCGGGSGPALEQADAQQLIALAHRVSTAADGCAQQKAIARVETEAHRLIAERRVPPELQEPLMSGVNALVDDQPTCLPDVAPTTTQPAVVAPPGPPGHAKGHGHEKHDHGGHHEHGHGHGHGRGH